MKDNSDQDSWFSAKPIIVGNFNYILAGTELNLRQDVFFFGSAKQSSINFANRQKLENTFYSCIDRGIVKILLVSM